MVNYKTRDGINAGLTWLVVIKLLNVQKKTNRSKREQERNKGRTREECESMQGRRNGAT